MNIRTLIISSLFIVFSYYVFSQEEAPAGQETDKVVARLDSYFEKAMEEWEIPGMAVGIVKNDNIVFTKGYGVRELGIPGKVDENTMFGIASLTKAFTAASMALLVEEGKIDWEDRVIDHLPYFQLYDPYVTNEMRIRDLLCHRTGLVTFSGDLLWDATTYSREEVIQRARYLKPVYGFRSHYGYSNIMFLTAGEIVPVITGKSWDDFVKEKFFDPLGMKNTNTTVKKHKDVSNLAVPHCRYEDRIIPIRYISWDNIASAGGINSTVTDMLQWIRMHLNNGTLDDEKYLDKSSLKELWSAQTVKSITRTDEYLFPSKHFSTYGLGWSLFDYHGRKVINHGGGLDGMVCHLALVPEEDLGFIILTNSSNYLPYVLMYKVIDEFLGVEGKDYSSIYLQGYKMSLEEEKKEREEAEKNRDKDSKPSLQLEKYAGTYGGELYGNAVVSVEDGKLKVQFLPAPDFYSFLNHWQYDTFTIRFEKFPSLPQGTVNFVIDAKGEVTEMKIDVPNPDFDFTELEFKRID